jgi:hypothetical protein
MTNYFAESTSLSILPFEQRRTTAPNGDTVYGEICRDAAHTLSVASAPIYLLNGFDRNGKGFGLRHITAKNSRSKQIVNLGFRNIEKFVWHVCQTYTEIRQCRDSRLMLCCEHEGHKLTAIIEWRQEHTSWSVITALPKRIAREKVIWRKEREGQSEPKPAFAEKPRFATLSLPKKPAGKES